jgi:DNA-binding CsgD family transcriptional regulator
MTAADAVYPRPVVLTRREQEVLHAVASRFTNAEIARALHVSKRTVESHVSALYRKLGVASRRELVTAGGRPADDPEVAAPHSERVDAARVAFNRAVQTERNAIKAHEAAGRRLDQLADELEADARGDRDAEVRAHAMAVAARARIRAGAARQRAETVRRRLRDEGIHPEA